MHSILAASFSKNFFIEKLNFSEKGYRLVYVLVSSVAFIFIIAYMATFPHHYLWSLMISKFVGLMLATYGIFIIREAFRNYNTKAFLGLREPKEESKKLITEGIQRHIRHPLYAGTILILAGFFFYMPTQENLAVVIISIIYIFVGINIEEKKLGKQFGKEYDQYKKKVPMLIPRLKK